MTLAAGSTGRPGLLLVAASGLAREVAEAASSTHRLLKVLDDDQSRWGELLAGVSVTGPIDPATVRAGRAGVLICAGKGRARRRIEQRLAPGGPGPDYLSLVHSSASVAASTSVGVGTVLLAGVITTADVTIGDHVVIMPGCILTHDTVVADFATLCAGAILSGSVVIETEAYLGTGCLIREGVRVGSGATVGMGAVVLNDVPAGETWVGNPARPIRVRV